jgi:hypothetical protein
MVGTILLELVVHSLGNEAIRLSSLFVQDLLVSINWKRSSLLHSWAGLPDGLFSNQKSKFGEILVGLALVDVGIFYGHLVHFTVFCYTLWAFDIVRGNLLYFFPFWYFVLRKIWQPCSWVSGDFLKFTDQC